MSCPLEDYELARQTFAGYVEGTAQGNMALLIRASGHLENCLTSLQRTYRYAERLGKLESFEAYFESAVALRPQERERVRQIRNASEHMDERVVDGDIAEGELVNLWMGEDAMELDGLAIKFSELATWLTELGFP